VAAMGSTPDQSGGDWRSAGLEQWCVGAWGARGVNGRGAREASSVGRIERAQAPSVFSTILWTSLDLLH
jgi:hypothetical protein